MAISGKLDINIGLPNESTGSDSLFDAFTKTKNNFNTLFSDASPYNTFNANAGISITTNANSGIVDITNTGVLNIVAGTGITINQSNGNVTITNSGGNGNGSGVTSVGVSSSTLTINNSPIVSSGNIVLNLPNLGITAGTYTNPTVAVDIYGRITTISNNTIAGTVTSVGITPGAGISVTSSPITTSGNMTVTNTGVTRINAGSGIAVSSANGNVTISTTPIAAVTSVALSSSSLTVTGSPITGSGTITVDLPANITVTGNANIGNIGTSGIVIASGNINGANLGTGGLVTASGNITGGNLITAGLVSATGNVTANSLLSSRTLYVSGSEDLADAAAANLQVMASYFSTSAAETATLADGLPGQFKTFMMMADLGDMVITVTNAAWGGSGTITFDSVGDSCMLQYVASKWFVVGNNGCTFA